MAGIGGTRGPARHGETLARAHAPNRRTRYRKDGGLAALRRFLERRALPAHLLASATVTVLDAYGQLSRALGGQEIRNKSLLFRDIQRGIAELAAQGKQPVLVLDEADLLRSALFDELRILLNFEMDLKDPLLVILAGQPQLLAKLALRVHLPFRQRVAMRYRMPAMDETHTRGYVEHHLRLAGRKQRLFTDCCRSWTTVTYVVLDIIYAM